MQIINVKRGANSFNEFKGRILYAEVVDKSGSLVCSATLDFILKVFYNRQDEIENYEDALSTFIDFNEELIDAFDSNEVVCNHANEHWVYDKSGVDMYCKKCEEIKSKQEYWIIWFHTPIFGSSRLDVKVARTKEEMSQITDELNKQGIEFEMHKRTYPIL